MVKARRRSRLGLEVQRALLMQFVAGTPARMAAELTGVNRNTATLFYHKLRELIAAKLAEESPFVAGEIEVDESYFGGHRKGKRGRGAAGKVPVFGLLKRDAQPARIEAVVRPPKQVAREGVTMEQEQISPYRAHDAPHRRVGVLVSST